MRHSPPTLHAHYHRMSAELAPLLTDPVSHPSLRSTFSTSSASLVPPHASATTSNISTAPVIPLIHANIHTIPCHQGFDCPAKHAPVGADARLPRAHTDMQTTQPPARCWWHGHVSTIPRKYRVGHGQVIYLDHEGRVALSSTQEYSHHWRFFHCTNRHGDIVAELAVEWDWTTLTLEELIDLGPIHILRFFSDSFDLIASLHVHYI